MTGLPPKRFGFVVDNRQCIGCHACSTACKSENEVPLGVYRTWVKTTETGTFPNTQRHFQVTRCNHCDNPPCVRICPTSAMYQRDDGIVEFDSDACIGCKACMQACPYDSIHIDPASGTAAKCHFCAHRTEIGLEPACVVVCPEHAIVAGDLNDPTSEISRVIARNEVTVRKPEQGTSPQLFYIEGAEVNLRPTAAPPPDGTFAVADLAPAHQPLVVGGNQAGQMTQVGYNAQHRVPWHWPVPAYLVTKGIAAGVVLVLALAWALGAPFAKGDAVAVAALAVVFMGATTALLVADLEQPKRFLYLLMRPNWSSWLVRGAVFLIGYSTLATARLAAAWFDVDVPGAMAALVPFAIGTAVYTAFLFGQAEGRDLWQSPLLPVHLLVQAFVAGAAAVLLVGPSAELATVATWTLGGALVVDLFVILLGELGMPHATDTAAAAAHAMTRGRHARTFWFGALGVGHVLAGACLLAAFPIPAAVCALAGLYAYEHVFVMAPQEVPNS